jgi:RNA polymerase sigma factor (TIGR02999 family)
MTQTDRVLSLLDAARDGDDKALDEVFALVYEELRRLAKSQRRRWEGDYTLDTTALVHEAYLKLVDQGKAEWNSRGHFMAVAATAMRQILVNYAERRQALKRGGGQQDVTLDDSQGDANPVTAEVADEVIALHKALKELAKLNERQARVVEARFFAGLQIEETATALGISPATVKRDWTMASAWLHRQINLKLK